MTPSQVLPQEGDVLVIGVGELATRHTLSDYNSVFWTVEPPIEGETMLRQSMALAFIRAGATLEKKQEPLRFEFEGVLEHGALYGRSGLFGFEVSTDSADFESLAGLRFRVVLEQIPEGSAPIKLEDRP